MPIKVISSTDSCIDADDFYSLLSRRTPIIRDAPTSEPSIRFVLRIAGGEPATGELTVVSLDGSESSRTVLGNSCEEVADALSLIGALWIDPLATAVRFKSDDDSSSSPPAPQPQASRAVLRRNSSVSIRFAKVVPATPQPKRKTATAVDRVRHAAIIESFARIAFSGSPWIGLTAQYWLEPGISGIGPSPLRIMLAVARTLRASEVVEERSTSATLEYSLTSAELGLCPYGVRPIQSVEWLGCATVSAGWLQVHQGAPQKVDGDAGPYLAVGVASRLEVQLYRALGLSVALGMQSPMTQYRIQLDSMAGSPSARLSPVAFLGSIGAIVREW